MEKLTTASLTTIFSEVLGNLAFMFTGGDPAEPSPETTWLETTISYDGPATGTLKFQCTSEFGVLLAANLLGINPQDDDAESQAHDAVKELMNIVCGQFVTAIYGIEHVFDLTVPQTRELAETPDFIGHDDSLVFTPTVEGHRVQIVHVLGDNGDR